MKTPATFNARVVRDEEWFIAFSPEFPEGNGQGLTQEEVLESLRESILLLLEDRRELVPRHAEIPDLLARKICRALEISER